MNFPAVRPDEYGLSYAVQGLILIGLFLLCAVANSDSPSSAASADHANPEVIAASNSPAAVHLGNRKLFDVTSGIEGLTSTQRAQAIEARLNSIANGSATALQSLRVVELQDISEIFAGDFLIRTLTEKDAIASGTTRQHLADEQTQIIRSALAREFRDRDTDHILRSAAYAFIATLGIIAILFAIRRSYRWSHSRLNLFAVTWSAKTPLQRLKLLDSQALTKATRSIAWAVAWMIGVSAVYVYLEFVLALFPWTRGFAAQMSEASKAAILRVLWGSLDYLPNLISIVVIIAVVRMVLAALRRVFEQVAAERFQFASFHPEWAMPTYSLVRFFVIAVATIMVFPYLPGSGSEGFRGVSAFVGLMVSFGAAPAIANLIAGIIITYMRPFKVNDRVKIADATGDILGKDLLVVRMRTIKNVDITIPNALVLANHIVNFSSSAKTHGLILNTTITIGYSVPWKQVHALLIEAAKHIEGVLPKPEPFVLQTMLDDSYVSYEINAYTDRPNEMANLYSRLNESIQDVFNTAGVEILSPKFAAVRDGNAMAVPQKYLPKDYQQPGFTVLSQIVRPRRRD
jgi:small-conductance mechanosensitive channel